MLKLGFECDSAKSRLRAWVGTPLQRFILNGEGTSKVNKRWKRVGYDKSQEEDYTEGIFYRLRMHVFHAKLATFLTIHE